MTLKRVYRIKKSLYIYDSKNFLPYPMWDITNPPSPPFPYTDTTFLLYPMGLSSQTDKHPLWSQTNLHTRVKIGYAPNM